MKRHSLNIISIIILLILVLTACGKISDNITETSGISDNTTDVEEITTIEVPTGFPVESFCIYGRYLNFSDGTHILIKYGHSNTAYPAIEEEIIMQDEGEPVLLTADVNYAPDLAVVESNTAVWAIVNVIEETWPAKTTVYSLSAITNANGLNTISADKIPQISKELLDRLAEMGYE